MHVCLWWKISSPVCAYHRLSVKIVWKVAVAFVLRRTTDEELKNIFIMTILIIRHLASWWNFAPSTLYLTSFWESNHLVQVLQKGELAVVLELFLLRLDRLVYAEVAWLRSSLVFFPNISSASCGTTVTRSVAEWQSWLWHSGTEMAWCLSKCQTEYRCDALWPWATEPVGDSVWTDTHWQVHADRHLRRKVGAIDGESNPQLWRSASWRGKPRDKDWATSGEGRVKQLIVAPEGS